MSWDTKVLFMLGTMMMASGIAGMVRDMMRDADETISYMASYGEEW